MQVYGLVGQTEEGIWPEAQLRDENEMKMKNKFFNGLGGVIGVTSFILQLMKSFIHTEAVFPQISYAS